MTKKDGSPNHLLLLQRQAGNRAVGTLVDHNSMSVQRGIVGDMIRFERKEKAMMEMLASTPQGQQAITARDKYGITLSWVDSGGASFDGSDRCYLNQNLDTGVIAGYFIHEMYHVDRKKSGASPDADVSPVEQEYVDRMVSEEIEGTVRGFESRINSSGPLMPGEEYYQQVYKSAKGSALSNGADASTADNKGREAGRKIVSELIRPRDGTWARIAPNQFESYDMYYHRVWKKSHKIAPSR